MRLRNPLTSSLTLAFVAALATGCHAGAKFLTLEPPPTGVTEIVFASGGGTLPDGVQVTTDPNPHQTGRYQTPEWEPRTTVVAATLASVTRETITIVLFCRAYGAAW